MKITIELPVDTTPEQAQRMEEQMRRAIDSKWLALWWHVDDVYDAAEGEELTEEEAIAVLELLDESHDANEGVNWYTVQWAIEQIKAA